MRRIVSVLFLVVISIFLVSCENMTLTAPSTTLSGNTLSWDEVEDAANYYIYIDDNATSDPDATYFETTSTSFDLSSAELDDGTYTIYVVAVNGTYFSGQSNAIQYTVGEGDITLSVPTNVSITNDLLSWDAVTDATSYMVVIDELEVVVTTTSYDLTNQALEAGTYDIFVKAIAGDVESMNSALVNYVVLEDTLTLTAPENVTITGDSLSWDAVTNATSYMIVIDELSIPVSTTNYDLTNQALDPGTYDIYVKAIAGNIESSHSATVSYIVVEDEVELTAPENVMITGDLLSWDSVTDASGYIIHVNEEEIVVSTTSYDLDQLDLDPGSYTLSIVATSGDIHSEASSTVAYSVELIDNTDAIIAATLPMMDETYTVDMTVDDFSDDIEFGFYQNSVLMVSAYASASFESGLDEEDAIGFFSSLMTLTRADDEFESISDMMAMMDMFADNHITPEIASHLMMSVLTQGIAIQASSTVNNLTAIELNITEIQAEITAALNSVNAVTIFNTIASNVPFTALDTASEIAVGDLQSVLLLRSFLMIAIDRKLNFVYDNSHYYRDDLEDEQIDDLVNIVIAIENSEDELGLDLLNELAIQMNDVSELFNEIDDMSQLINYMNMMSARLDEMTLLMETEAESMEMMMTSMFDFMFTIQEAFPEEVMTLLDQAFTGETPLTITEMVYIKNELVSIVLEALPEEEAFQSFYESLLMINEVVFGNEIDNLDSDATYLGSLNYHMTHVGLLFIGSVSVADIGEAIILFDELQTAIEDDELSLENTEPIFNIFEFVNTYIAEFTEDNADAVADLEALLGSDLFKPIYEDMLEQVIALVNELDPEERDLIVYLIETMIDEYDHVITASQIMPNVTEGMIEAFIDSNGSVLSVINQFDNEDMTMEEVVTLIEDLIDEVMRYHDVLDDEFTQENIESLLSLVIIPIIIDNEAYLDEDSELALRALIPDMTDVITNVLSLEGDLMSVIDALNLSDYMDESLGFAEPLQLGAILMAIHVLDDVLTPENETLIANTLELVSNLSENESLQVMLDVGPIPEDSGDMVDELITMIHTFASYDIETLTLEQEEEIMTTLMDLGLMLYTPLDDEEEIENAMPLTIDVTASSLYRTSPLAYSFTAVESGYYTISASFDAEYGYMSLVTEDNFIVANWTHEGQLEFSEFLVTGQTYYVLLTCDQHIYTDIDVVVSQAGNPTALALDVMEYVNLIEDKTYYTFTLPLDGYYTLNLDSEESVDLEIAIYNTLGEPYADGHLYFSEMYTYYLDGETGMTYTIMVQGYAESTSLTMVVNHLDAVTMALDVPVSFSSDEGIQYAFFTVDQVGCYDIVAETNDVTTVFIFMEDSDEWLFSDSFELSTEPLVLRTGLLYPDERYRIEITNIAPSMTLNLTVRETALETLDVDTTLTLNAEMYEEIFVEIDIVEAGVYNIQFVANVNTRFNQFILNEFGQFMCELSADLVPMDRVSTDMLFFNSGVYYMVISTYDYVLDVNVELVPVDGMEAFADEEIMVVLDADHDEYMMFFSPTETGIYRIHSYNKGDSDPYVNIFLNHKEYDYADDSASDLNFDSKIYMEAGNEYELRFSSFSEFSTYYVYISLTDDDIR